VIPEVNNTITRWHYNSLTTRSMNELPAIVNLKLKVTQGQCLQGTSGFSTIYMWWYTEKVMHRVKHFISSLPFDAPWLESLFPIFV
jgi:hypothetical protein